jgi:hypothetical protein
MLYNPNFDHALLQFDPVDYPRLEEMCLLGTKDMHFELSQQHIFLPGKWYNQSVLLGLEKYLFCNLYNWLG